MEENQKISKNDLLTEIAKQMEDEAKQIISKEIKNISIIDIKNILERLNYLINNDKNFPNDIDKYSENEKEDNIIFLFHKLKYICYNKGILACFLLIDKNSLNLIKDIELLQKTENIFLLNTNELMNFVFLKIFRIGEQNIRYLKDENYFINFYKDNSPVLKFDEKLLEEPMKPPKNYFEILFCKYMILMNSEWNNDNYLKFVESYRQFKYDGIYREFFDILIKNVAESQKKYLMKIYEDNISLKDKTFFVQDEKVEIFENDGCNKFIEDIKIEKNFNKYENQFDYKLNDKDKYFLNAFICSFLNSEGGRIYIGINDEGKVLGISLDFKEKDILNGILNDMLKDLDPCVIKGEIKIYFIPIKNFKNEFIKGNYVIKIIVPQGDVNELYSISWKKYDSFMIEDNKMTKLDCKRIKEEIIKRANKEKQAIDNNIFNDKEPEQAVFPKI